jgi:hypothetical protein
MALPTHCCELTVTHMTMTYVRTGLHALLTFQKNVISQDVHKVHSPHVTNVYVVVKSDPANTRQTVQIWFLVTQRLPPSLTVALDLLVLQ